MKKVLLVFGLVCSTLFAKAQEVAKVGIKNADYDALKKIAVKNPDKDTYIKEGAYVLDNSNPPYVFKFSDGKERRIYLYKVLETAEMKEMGSLMVFTTPKDGKKISLVVPNPMAEKEVWGKYIDDLKDGEKAINGFSSCVAFVLAKEFTGGASGAEHGAEDKYEYCFPETAVVTMADGSQKSIAAVKAGEVVMSYNTTTNKAETTLVDEVIEHDNKSFGIVKVLLSDAEDQAFASTQPLFQLTELEGTANHPVLTTIGHAKLGNLKVGEQVLMYNSDTHTFNRYKVFSTNSDYRTVEKVYNLRTANDKYLVNSIVVLEK